MAGFGSISLAQTVVGTMLDQRAVVLYKQPNDYVKKEIKNSSSVFISNLTEQLWGRQFEYEELFAGLASQLGSDILTRIANVAGANPYGITYMSSKVDVESDLCEHPVEDGTIITDASIVLPVTAEVVVAMPTFFAERIYVQMYDLYKKKEDKIILQTKYGIYDNLVLQNMNYEIEHATVDRTIFTLSLKEVKEVSSYGDFRFNNVASPDKIVEGSDATTIKTGTQMAVGG